MEKGGEDVGNHHHLTLVTDVSIRPFPVRVGVHVGVRSNHTKSELEFRIVRYGVHAGVRSNHTKSELELRIVS